MARPYTSMDYIDATGASYDASNRLDASFIGNGNVSNVEFENLNGVTSNVQSQLTANETEASVARSIAEVAQAMSNDSLTIANEAQSNATDALSTANSAQSAADTAQSTANTAQSTANSALSTANSAQSTANTAQSTANSAQSTANDALTTANSKVEVADPFGLGYIANASIVRNEANTEWTQAIKYGEEELGTGSGLQVVGTTDVNLSSSSLINNQKIIGLNGADNSANQNKVIITNGQGILSWVRPGQKVVGSGASIGLPPSNEYQRDNVLHLNGTQDYTLLYHSNATYIQPVRLITDTTGYYDVKYHPETKELVWWRSDSSTVTESSLFALNWTMVKRIEPGTTTWHPGNDNFAGTFTTGTPGTGTFSIAYNNTEFTHFLVAQLSDDGSGPRPGGPWLICTKEVARDDTPSPTGEPYLVTRLVLHSSESLTPYNVQWIKPTGGGGEWPWLSTVDFSIATSNGKIVFAENSYPTNANNGLPAGRGAGVWIINDLNGDIGVGTGNVYAKAILPSSIQIPTDTAWRSISTFTPSIVSNANSITSSGFTAIRNGVYMIAFSAWFQSNDGGNTIGLVSTRIKKGSVIIHESSNGNNEGPHAYHSISAQVMETLIVGETITPEYQIINTGGLAVQLLPLGTHLSVWSVD